MFIIVGELLIAIAFTLLAKLLPHASWSRTVALSVAGAAAIFIAYAAGYGITDGFARK